MITREKFIEATGREPGQDRIPSDYDLPFEQRYLACAEALERAAHWLAVCGLSGNRNLSDLQKDFITHGAVTFRDINRDKQ